MPVLKLIRWTLLYLLAHIEFTACQNITVLVHFGSYPDIASVVAADPNAATYLATYTNMCRSGPCSPLTIYTNIMVQGPSTAARTNIGGGQSQTFACVVTSSLTTGTCTYEGSVATRSTPEAQILTPMESSFFRWSALVVTAGMDKLSYLTVATTNGAVSATIPTNATSTRTLSASSTPSATTPPSATSASTLSATTLSASSSSAINTASNSGATSTVGTGSTAAKGAAAGCQTGYPSYAIAGLAGVVIAAL